MIIHNIKAYKNIIRKYYKYNIFEQPILTANGTMGGNNFACDQSASYNSTTVAWRCFNGNTTSAEDVNRWQINSVKTSTWYWISWYNPTPIKITNLVVYNAREDYVVKAYKIQGSNDNSTWIDVVTGTNTNTTELGSWTIDMSSNTNFYNYYRIYCQPNSTTSIQIAEITITAITKDTHESTISDYDFYKDIEEYKVVKKTIRNYYKWTPWTQPIFTSENTWGTVSADNYSSSNQYPWHAVDGLTTGGDEADFAAADSAKTVNWYWDFVEPLKITAIKIWNRANAENYGGATTYTIYGKNEDGSYDEIGTLSLTAVSWVSDTVSISSTKTYIGLKIYCSGSIKFVGIGEILLTAYTLQQGTVSNYDYYEDTYNCKLISEGSVDIPWYKVGDTIIDKGNAGAFTFEDYLYPGTYKLTLAAGGQSSSNGYYYWPAGYTGNGLICNISIDTKSKITASIGAGGTGTSHAAGKNTTLYVDDAEAIILGGGKNNSIFTMNTNIINITSIDLQDSSGGSNYNGSGSNPSPLTPWADGGYTSNSSGHGGGVKLVCLSLI